MKNETLAHIIKYHASPGSYDMDMLKDGMNLYMATGHYVKVERNGDEVKVGGAKILGTMKASNGIVHVVDTVLLPPD
ncbi:MAG: fasciclin domain-containing protein [Lewinellaceae bacterium]|nr:fasciclin domain-containing protein [Phaeodactylibacter sp.]MCB9348047.1 fasciclin domain-containing protein [Lewinellaceae bacterium]